MKIIERIMFIVLLIILLSIDGGVVSKFKVEKVFPKIITPTNNTLTIEVVDDGSGMLNIEGKIFDITGREVAKMELVEGSYEPFGRSILEWRPPLNIPTGVYIYQLSASGQYYNGSVVVAR